jgi:hypothetical protein
MSRIEARGQRESGSRSGSGWPDSAGQLISAITVVVIISAAIGAGLAWYQAGGVPTVQAAWIGIPAAIALLIVGLAKK